ncbi:MAG: hypothetical protein EU539_08540 [Promethearchaeota archaeon]|nr:MAG: hypothetical protein EU539_08540 [Candidatus Lokiarchaeota archaeon]
MKILISQSNLIEDFFGNNVSISLFIIFLVALGIGTLMIYLQVALVLKGDFKLQNKVQCIIFGMIFSLSVMIVVAMAFIFAINTPQFWRESGTEPPELSPNYFLIPFMVCLAYISFYPLIDFLFIALSEESDEGLTPFHKFIGSIWINRSNNKIIRVILAVIFYFAIFFFPPIFLSLIGLPFIMIWISWMLIYPLMILTFYGSKGYIAGITYMYYHIPDIKRSVFLGFEDGKRTMKEFINDPAPRIVLGMMLFVFVWAWISMFQTIGFYFSGSLLISPYSYAGFVFVTLAMGVIGFFTRFWGRKIKYRAVDIYFAAYLIAAVGINVLVNFLIVNAEKLTSTFNILPLTNEINTNYLMFAWAAVIEEIMLIIFTSYFFLAQKSEFNINIKYSMITKSGQTFDPIPLFNLIKNNNPVIRKHAESTLLMMYERIPLKNELNLDDMKFKNPLIDGLCDSNPNSKEICYKILVQLESDVPDIVISWIIEALKSPNYDKSIPFAKSLLIADIDLLKEVPKELILNIIKDPEWELRLIGLKIYSRLINTKNASVSDLDLYKLINNPNSQFQVEILKIMEQNSISIPIDIIFDKLKDKNDDIRSAAIQNIKNIVPEKIDPSLIAEIKHFMEDPNSSVRASIFKVLGKIGNFKKYGLPLLPFLNGLVDVDEDVREASIFALEKYFNEEPESLNIDLIINRIDPNDVEILNSVLSLLGKLWEQNPEKILNNLLNFIKFESDELKENISRILIKNYPKHPQLVIDKIIKVPDVSKYISKGIISKTIIQIGKNHPNEIISLLFEYLDYEQDEIRLNAISSLEGLADEYPAKMDVKPIFYLLQNDRNQQVRKEASKIIAKKAQKDPSSIKTNISAFLEALDQQEPTVKITISKSLLEIARTSPEIIPLDSIIKFLSDEDPFIRESGAKILGSIGYKSPDKAVSSLINDGLNDDEWIVREASVSSLGSIVNHISDKGLVIQKLVKLLDDEKAWVRRSVMNILSDIKDLRASHVPYEKLSENLNHEDPKVREASAKLLKIHGSLNIENVFNDIISLLEDDSEDVRDSMINTVVEIIKIIGLDKLLPRLLKNLSDEYSLELQRSIAIILGRTARYEEEKIKKRIIALLKIRCEMSQDPIICDNLHKISES